MYVRKVDGARAGQPAVELVDGDGEVVSEVSAFLRLLTVRDYSPNTVRAYAHDLQKLFQFGTTGAGRWTSSRQRGRSSSSSGCALARRVARPSNWTWR